MFPAEFRAGLRGVRIQSCSHSLVYAYRVALAASLVGHQAMWLPANANDSKKLSEKGRSRKSKATAKVTTDDHSTCWCGAGGDCMGQQDRLFDFLYPADTCAVRVSFQRCDKNQSSSCSSKGKGRKGASSNKRSSGGAVTEGNVEFCSASSAMMWMQSVCVDAASEEVQLYGTVASSADTFLSHVGRLSDALNYSPDDPHVIRELYSDALRAFSTLNSHSEDVLRAASSPPLLPLAALLPTLHYGFGVCGVPSAPYTAADSLCHDAATAKRIVGSHPHANGLQRCLDKLPADLMEAGSTQPDTSASVAPHARTTKLFTEASRSVRSLQQNPLKAQPLGGTVTASQNHGATATPDFITLAGRPTASFGIQSVSSVIPWPTQRRGLRSR